MREETRRFLIGISILAVLVLGLLYWSRSEVKPRANVPAAPAVASASEPEMKPPAQLPARQVPATKTAPVRAQPAPAHPPPIEAATAEKSDRIEFPSSLKSQFTAAGFHDAFARVMAACKFDFAVEAEDCTEYPCVEWGTWPGDHVAVDECPAWKETFGDKVFVFTHTDTDGHHFIGLSALSPDVQGGGGVVPHLLARGNGMTDAAGADGTSTVAGPVAPKQEAPRRQLQHDSSELRSAPEARLARGN